MTVAELHEQMKLDRQELLDRLDRLDTSVQTVHEGMAHMRGVWKGGLALSGVISAIVSAFVALIDLRGH